MPQVSGVDGTINIQLDVGDFARVTKEYYRNSTRAIDHALEVVAKQLLRDSRLFVPVLTGRLRDSGRTESTPTVSDAVRAFQVVYGSEQVKYAFKQHEGFYRHPSLGFTGRARYLAKPLEKNYRFYQILFAAEYEVALRRLY